MIHQTWLMPFVLLVAATVIAFPLSRYLAWVMDGKFKDVPVLGWFERRLDSGPQKWQQYTASLLVFNVVLFILGFLVLTFQPWLPLNPDAKGMLAPTTIFQTAIAMMSNTDMQHYAGDVHLSNFSQIFFGLSNFFLSASVGFCALVAIIRAFRGVATIGNFFVDMWRVVIYIFLPACLVFGLIFMALGSPMTLKSSYQVATLEPGAMGSTDKGELKKQTIVVGPVAAFEAIKQLGTNGGGFFGMNAAHPFENPTGLANFFNTLAMMLFPFALVLMYGRMLGRLGHGVVIFSVMLTLMAGSIAWSVYFDTLQPNPGLTSHAARSYVVPNPKAPGGKQAILLPAVAGLPVDQHLGNLEGKELRFGTSAGATYAAITTDVTCGSVNAEMDSMNPLATLAPLTGMWLNCIFGGKGVGVINMLMFIILGIFIAGMMVGRTPEYLGRKIGAREGQLALLTLLIHPLLLLMPTGLFAAVSWGLKAITNPGAHGFTQILWQFTSVSANNGSACDGLAVASGFAKAGLLTGIPWDIVTGVVMIFGRFVPIIAPIAMAAYLGAKKASPDGLGTLHDDTPTFGILLIVTILIVGALLFLPVAVLGPVAEHLGPMPFGG